jgi:16S rRNA (cytidine1402-2'-O)-methyltransferase
MEKKDIKLYVIPSSITGDFLVNTLRADDLDIVKSLDTYIVETAKVARRHLAGLELETPIQQIEMFEVNEHTRHTQMKVLLDEAFLLGKDIGLMSDAGSPSVADPGWRVVQYAQDKGIQVVPITGPSSIFMALMASGLNGQRFVFHGYLNKEQGKRGEDIQRLERDSLNKDQTQIFMETPYKNEHMFADILANCSPNTYLCLGQNVMHPKGFVKTKLIKDWQKENINMEKVPTLFLIYAPKYLSKKKGYRNGRKR